MMVARSWFGILVAALLLVPSSNAALAAAKTGKLVTRTTFMIGEDWYRADIAETITDGSTGDVLTISCAGHCKHPIRYEEDNLLGPMGMFIFFAGDQQQLVVLTGAESSNLDVDIYDLRETGITKVLSATTKGFPAFDMKDGQPIAIINQRDDPANRSYPFSGVLWRYDGHRYVMSKTGSAD